MATRKKWLLCLSVFFFMEIDFLSDFLIERKIFDILNCLITIGINSAKLENLYGNWLWYVG